METAHVVTHGPAQFRRRHDTTRAAQLHRQRRRARTDEVVAPCPLAPARSSDQAPARKARSCGPPFRSGPAPGRDGRSGRRSSERASGRDHHAGGVFQELVPQWSYSASGAGASVRPDESRQDAVIEAATAPVVCPTLQQLGPRRGGLRQMHDRGGRYRESSAPAGGMTAAVYAAFGRSRPCTGTGFGAEAKRRIAKTRTSSGFPRTVGRGLATRASLADCSSSGRTWPRREDGQEDRAGGDHGGPRTRSTLIGGLCDLGPGSSPTGRSMRGAWRHGAGPLRGGGHSHACTASRPFGTTRGTARRGGGQLAVPGGDVPVECAAIGACIAVAGKRLLGPGNVPRTSGRIRAAPTSRCTRGELRVRARRWRLGRGAEALPCGRARRSRKTTRGTDSVAARGLSSRRRTGDEWIRPRWHATSSATCSRARTDALPAVAD